MSKSIKNQLITIGTATVPVIEYRGKRVVTFAMLDQVHLRPEGTASRKFCSNRACFIEGDDFHLIDFSESDEIRSFGIDVTPHGLTLLTKLGYLKLESWFIDERSWSIQMKLIDNYFFIPPPRLDMNELMMAIQRRIEQEERLNPSDSYIVDILNKWLKRIKKKIDKA
ncbi:MAG: ORF6N domain-containing protein [Magnetococcales bacterium]|nr:ORF6N domain-containing protein [Magnetococcales bacterium]